MSAPFAEVIGDPVAQTKSPPIHRHWLAALGLRADYRATRVERSGLAGFLAARRADPDWRGCNVTIPHKQAVPALLERLDPGAAAIGAVNCIVPDRDGLSGYNTDIDGVAAALGGAAIGGRKAALIGGGGGARAALRYLVDAGAAEVSILVRDPERARHLAQERIRILPFEQCDSALRGAAAIVNATPLGMAGAPPMPQPLIACVRRNAAGATLLDMVYSPLETAFLAAGRAGGGTAVDGLVMLVGQARAAFRLFFGEEPPPGDEAVRALIAASG